MKFYLKYDIHLLYKKILETHLHSLGVAHKMNGLGEVEFLEPLDTESKEKFISILLEYGIYVVNDHKSEVVQRIKDCVSEMVTASSSNQVLKTSVYLSEKLNLSYTSLSAIFSEHTHTSIENFVIIKRIDRAKTLLLQDKLTLTQIAYELSYSSVSHLSAQFKKVTGLTPTTFQRIIKARNKNSQ